MTKIDVTATLRDLYTVGVKRLQDELVVKRTTREFLLFLPSFQERLENLENQLCRGDPIKDVHTKI